MPQINRPRFTWERKRGRETKQQSAIPHSLKAGVGRKKNEKPWSERVDSMHSASVSDESGDAY